MDLWDRDAIDLVRPAIIEITTEGRGFVRFIAVEGCIDASHVDLDGRPAVEFSWDGYDERDQVSGRGGPVWTMMARCEPPIHPFW